jgi:hypothetical protein
MFTAAHDAAAGIPVVNEVYPPGEKGIGKSLETMCRMIREGSATAIMKSFAGNLLRQAGWPNVTNDTAAARATAVLDYVRKHVTYAHDVLGTEQIQRGSITLCVDGAPICIPIGDCDDLTVATGETLGAMGLEVELVRQFFGPGKQQHVLLEVKLENGTWFPLDPSSKLMPAGKKAKAVKETRCSPWDESVTGFTEAQFVGIGGLPVFLYGKEGWTEVKTFTGGEDQGTGGGVNGTGLGNNQWYPVGKDVQAPLPPGKVILWQGGWWYRDPETGIAFQWTCCEGCAHGGGCKGLAKVDVGMGISLADIQPQLDWIGQAWSILDPKGRDFQTAKADALVRAAKMDWKGDKNVAKYDLLALVIASMIGAALIRDTPGYGAMASDSLLHIWKLWATDLGYHGESADDLRALLKKKGNATAYAWAEIVLIIGVAIVAAAAIAVVAYFVADSGERIIEYKLAEDANEDERIRLHAEKQKIIDRHLDGSPLTPAEEEILKTDEESLKRISPPAPLPPKPPEPPSPWPWVIGAAVVGAVVLGVAYAPEIKDMLKRRRPALAPAT